MKSLTTLLGILIFAHAELAFPSENTWSAQQKVNFSDIVAVCTVKSVKFGEVKKHKNYNYYDTQEVELVVSIDDFIKGKSDNNIKIFCYASSYQISPKISVWSSSGFRTRGIKKGNKHIAYLKKIETKYYLSMHSNQYLEEIDKTNNTVKLSFTNKKVTLEERVSELRALAKPIKKDKKK